MAGSEIWAYPKGGELVNSAAADESLVAVAHDEGHRERSLALVVETAEYPFSREKRIWLFGFADRSLIHFLASQAE
jgi:hypothetical protein